MKLSKIFIMGIAGSGKTYLASKISKKLQIKSHELDEIIFNKNNFIRIDDKKRDEKIKKILKHKKWIIEGSYTKEWVNPMIKEADLIIALKIHPFKTKQRIIMRFIKRKIKKGKRFESLKDFFNLIKHSNKTVSKRKIDHTKELAEKNKKKLLILRNKRQIKKFLRKLK